MCRAVTCQQCGKTTWAGCGKHIDQVRSQVPASDWCPGHPRQASTGGRGLLARLFGRTAD